MPHDNHMSRCIDTITVTKDRCRMTCTDSLRVSVTLKQSAVLAVQVRNPDEWMMQRASPAEVQHMAERRRREVAHLISRAFTAEIECAVGRLDAAALSGETITLRKGGYA